MITDDRADEVSLTEQGQLIAAVERFEADWRAGRGPRIEDALDGVDGPRWSRWLCELIRLELELRARDGDRPRPDDYLRRFPDRSAEIAATFADRAGPPVPPSGAEPPGTPRSPGYGTPRSSRTISGRG
jgi:hypothetical protein